MSKIKYHTSESVASGHPDKLCDQISDAVLDEVLRIDKQGRVACETYVTMGLLIIGGEITVENNIPLDIHEIARDVIRDIGYTEPKYGFDYHTCAILNAIHKQSPDIAQGVNQGGAGDQGVMFGYACDETPELMPLPIMLSHRLIRNLEYVRKQGILGYLGPDGKSQVTIEYADGVPRRVDSVVLACQHTEDILDATGRQILDKARHEMIDVIVRPIVGDYIDSETRFYVNQTGRFIVGGPQSDTGMTGRKIVVDTYGGTVPVGGGAFSGKDPSKVDRSASYMARYIAKNIVAAGLARKCLIELSYVIGKAEPLAVGIETFGTAEVSEDALMNTVTQIFDLTPRGIIRTLDLLRPIYRKTACYGHFGRSDEDLTWEQTNMIETLREI